MYLHVNKFIIIANYKHSSEDDLEAMDGCC